MSAANLERAAIWPIFTRLHCKGSTSLDARLITGKYIVKSEGCCGDFASFFHGLWFSVPCASAMVAHATPHCRADGERRYRAWRTNPTPHRRRQQCCHHRECCLLDSSSPWRQGCGTASSRGSKARGGRANLAAARARVLPDKKSKSTRKPRWVASPSVFFVHFI